MLPIVLNPEYAAVGLAGAGPGLERRRAVLEQAGFHPVPITADAGDIGLRRLAALFIAGLADAAALAARARALGVLVNVEDVPQLCDFHVPATVRRGDLLLTVSTGGRAPGLARIFREWLEQRVPHEWEGRLAELSEARARWRASGSVMADVAQRTRDFVAGKGWLA